MDASGDRNGDFSVISMTNHETGTYEVRPLTDRVCFVESKLSGQ